MPEIPEIHSFKNTINNRCGGMVWTGVKTTDHPKYSNFKLSEPVNIRSEARGKELCLFLSPIGGGPEKSFLFNHGLVGRWIFSPKSSPPANAHIQFYGDHDFLLSYVDTQKMGSWQPGGWGNGRGPDPIDEHDEFCKNVIKNITKSAFNKPIAVTMLDQTYFNGIGNYLRAEILHRAGVDPLESAHDVFKNCAEKGLLEVYHYGDVRPDSDKGILVLYLCKALPEEVLEKGLNKYGTPEEQKAFHEWLRIYEKGSFKQINGRKIYYSPNPTLPDLPMSTGPILIYIPNPWKDTSSILVKEEVILPLHVDQVPTGQPSKEKDLVHINLSTTVLNTLFDPSSPLSSSPISTMSKLLFLISELAKQQLITPHEKDLLKMNTLCSNTVLYSAFDVFLKLHDLYDFIDTAKLLTNQIGCTFTLPQNNEQVSLPQTTPISHFVKIESTLKNQFSIEKTSSTSFSGNSNDMTSYLKEPGWKSLLKSEFSEKYFQDIVEFVANERKKHTVYPPEEEVFSAFNFTPLDKVKVVIIGQDPYFNPGQANGLCFSVKRGVKVPPSLARIYQVLSNTIPGFTKPKHGSLEEWAAQGVLLLNATLTVQEGKPNSHAQCGWQTFTDKVIAILNQQLNGLVFLLWGAFAQKKGINIHTKKHSVLHAAHPSPMSGNGFLTCEHFVQCNTILESMGKTPINWNLSP